METTNEKKSTHSFVKYSYKRRNPAGRMLGGLVIITVGVLILLKKMGVYFPSWLFSFPMLLVAIGVYFGAKRLFSGFGWLIPVIIGLALLIERIEPSVPISTYIWPAIIILVGLAMMLGSRRKKRIHDWETTVMGENEITSDDHINSVSVFGGSKKNIISKNFKGGEAVCVFGGSEINLMQSDIQGKIEMEVVQAFGGIKLIVPANWKIQNDVTAILGGIEDNRNNNVAESADKILVLKGAVVFGGIEIVSY